MDACMFVSSEHTSNMTGLMRRRYGQMKIKPIKTEKDYKSVLEVIQKLWDAEPNTPEGDTLEVLITLVEAYEEKHYHIDPPKKELKNNYIVITEKDIKTKFKKLEKIIK